MTLAGLLFILINLSAVAAEGFQAEGVVTVQQVGESKTVKAQEKQAFSVFVRKCRWLIVNTPLPVSPNNEIVSWRIGSDKTGEIYQVTLLNKSLLRSNSLNDATASVRHDSVPESLQGSEIAELWLAFASSCYLDGATNGMLKPVYALPDWSFKAGNHTVLANLERFELGPRLPKRIQYYENDQIVFMNGQVGRIPLPAEFGKSFLRAEYATTGVTNLGGMQFPTGFEFTEYAISSGPGKPQRVPFRIVRAEVTNIVTRCDLAQFTPELTDATYVEDRRFDYEKTPVESLAYMVTNKIWPEKSSAFLQQLYSKETNARTHMISGSLSPTPEPVPKVKVKFFIAVLLVFQALVFLMLFLYKQKQKKRKTNI